jgi:hypothetical protein
MPHLGYTSDECVEYPVKREELVVKWTLNLQDKMVDLEE